MTPDIGQLLIFNPDLTIAQYFKMYPPEKEYQTIVLQSKINSVMNIHYRKIDFKILRSENMNHDRILYQNEVFGDMIHRKKPMIFQPFLPSWKG